jgi:hypothetical protein
LSTVVGMKTFSVATAAATATALLALALTGCGITGSPRANSTSSAARSGTDSAQKDQELKYVQCLRKNGMKIADPVNGRYDIDNSESKDPKSQAAVKACAQYAPSTQNDKISAKELDGLMKMAQCLRRHGIKVQDPTPTANRHQATVIPSGTSAEQFQKVQQVCQKETGQSG